MYSKKLSDRLLEEIDKVPSGITAVANHLGTVRNTVYNWCTKGNIPANKLELLSKLGMDTQYILTGIKGDKGKESTAKTVRYKESDATIKSRTLRPTFDGSAGLCVTENRTDYTEGQQPERAGGISEEEAVLVRKYRQLPPEDRTHAQAIISAFADSQAHRGNVEEK